MRRSEELVRAEATAWDTELDLHVCCGGGTTTTATATAPAPAAPAAPAAIAIAIAITMAIGSRIRRHVSSVYSMMW